MAWTRSASSRRHLKSNSIRILNLKITKITETFFFLKANFLYRQWKVDKDDFTRAGHTFWINFQKLNLECQWLARVKISTQSNQTVVHDWKKVWRIKSSEQNHKRRLLLFDSVYTCSCQNVVSWVKSHYSQHNFLSKEE